MNLQQLIELCREEADDKANPQLWSDPLMVKYANQADFEAARRSRFLKEAVNQQVCIYAVKKGDPWICLHPSVITIEHARLEYKSESDPTVTLKQHLEPAVRHNMDRSRYDWRDDQPGVPCHYITDMQVGHIRFDLTPRSSGRFIIECARTPLKTMESKQDRPEMPERYHPDLIHWMHHKMYLRRDSDGKDNGLATRALALFERVFGQASSAIHESMLAGRVNERLAQPHVRFC